MVGFVLLNYMAYQETISCISSIEKLSNDIHIVVVDNHSSNNSFNILTEMYNKKSYITVLDSGSNLGFAKGNNIGYAYLRENFKCDFIIVMNNDMVIKQSNFIDSIYEIFKRTKFYVLGPDIYSTRDNRHQNPESYSNYNLTTLKKIYLLLTLKKIFSFLFYIKWFVFSLFRIKKKTVIKENDYKVEQFDVVMHGSCYIFSRLFIDNESECFYKETFMYFESYILAYLCERKHYLTVYSPKLLVYHHEDASTDYVFKNKAKKAVFGIKCLKQSCNEFIKLMEEQKA